MVVDGERQTAISVVFYASRTWWLAGAYEANISCKRHGFVALSNDEPTLARVGLQLPALWEADFPALTKTSWSQ